jgi:hypothetical protein
MTERQEDLNGKKPVLINGNIEWVIDDEALPREDVLEFLEKVCGCFNVRRG